MLGQTDCGMLEMEVGTEEPDLLVEGSSSEWLLLRGGPLSPSVLETSTKRPSSKSHKSEVLDPARDPAR